MTTRYWKNKKWNDSLLCIITESNNQYNIFKKEKDFRKKPGYYFRNNIVCSIWFSDYYLFHKKKMLFLFWLNDKLIFSFTLKNKTNFIDSMQIKTK